MDIPTAVNTDATCSTNVCLCNKLASYFVAFFILPELTRVSHANTSIICKDQILVCGDKGAVSKALTDEGCKHNSEWAFTLEHAAEKNGDTNNKSGH